MIEEILDIQTKDGAMETFVVRPERNGPHPLVIFMMDAPGIREELHEMARRLATVGFFVIQPNLYYRAGRDFKNFGPHVLDEDHPARERMRTVRSKMTIPPVMEDVDTMIEWADEHPDAQTGGPIGIHGYCMSGPYAIAAAARFADRIAAAASFYATHIVSDAAESPHLNLAKVKGELYMNFAEFDDLAPPEMVAEMDRLFEEAGTAGELEVHHGVHHGFAFPERWCYDKPAAERHWERLISLYRRRLD